MALISLKKKHLKSVAEYINDFLCQQDSSFQYLTWYLMALDIIECKLFVEPPQPQKRVLPKYQCTISFVNKGLDFINFQSILHSDDVLNNCPLKIDNSEIPMIVYSLCKPVRSKVFNYHDFVSNLHLNEFVNDSNSIECHCKDFDSSFINNDHGHILTGDLRIISNDKLRKLLFKGPKHRERIC